MLYHFFSVDIIFVEEYKKKFYPKVVLIRGEDDLSLLNSLVNVRCVISHVKLNSRELKHYQVFQLEDDDLYIDFLMKEAMKKAGTELCRIFCNLVFVEEMISSE
ncbi:hypothetical protein DJ93_681 [Bacillus clarus]|uniref:Uncharacterized protein n=1 Tax=Bacillus clarus TaxID=2338372 RepID=A0A090YSP1_9BACI|nr:hypothetical protein DJ93_681 [Bacillus clarus]